jgi:AraC-like DNA-binding protein/quercetin dioxygenase-like cupin family protein
VHQSVAVAKPVRRHNISLVRQGLLTEYDPGPGVSVATLAYEYPPGFLVPEHCHGSDQVIYATRGVMQVSAGSGYWMIPPQFAIWIPALTPHRIRMPRAVSMRTLYLRRELAARPSAGCTVLHVTPLLRELIVETVRMGSLRARNRPESALRDVLIAQLRKASPVPTFVTMPRDSRALAVAQTLIADPAGCPPLDVLCAKAGFSIRTMERTFLREVGMSFESWRRQARLMKAVELLVGGCAVKEVAFEVGYRQPSAFVAMFRAALGATPKAWVAALTTPAE